MAELVIRPYEDTDEDAVLGLLATSLGKTADDRYRRFFRWKHLENPFGRSLMWVGEVDDQLAGFRAFLRWRFIDPGGAPVEAVRAVDTATDPACRGLGVFRRLTLHGLDEMRPLGIAFVFNTPNDQSRPGYLKMGWEALGRVPLRVRPLRLRSLPRMLRARTAAELWSLPSDVGTTVAAAADQLDEHRATGTALETDRGREHLLWRYAGFGPIESRAVPLGAAGTFAVVRFRRRGPAIEGTVGSLVTPADTADRVPAGPLLQAARAGGCDFLLTGPATRLRGFVPAPRLGPILTWRALGRREAPDLELSLGDIELL